MLKKNNKLNQWLWKWHFIAGLVSLPFIILLAITGGIYLFKDNYDGPKQEAIKVIKAEGDAISFQKQWELAKTVAKKQPNIMVIPNKKNKATEFVSGRFSHKNSVYINPYKGEVSGKISPKDSKMHTVRKLHGELLLGKFGTKIIEFIASWMVVLIITGIYVFWPSKKQGLKGFFTVRLKQGKRMLFRDLHAVLGFWISLLLLLTLAGGFPWTDVFGANFKWVQKVTNTGYPKTWDASTVQSKATGEAMPLDAIVALAKSINLEGEVSIGLPKNEKGVYSIFNTTFNLGKQKRFHFDQYTGEQLVKHEWGDVGILMRGRLWLMAFHQGQFGQWNWFLMLSIAVLLLCLSIAGLLSYLKRKQKGNWGTPKVPGKFKVGYGIIACIVLLGLVFPLFGISAILIVIIEFLRTQKKSKTV
ncbi:PepSY-associated TM helix domain-containing protein [Pontimicrobium sp. MEBiC06410]